MLRQTLIRLSQEEHLRSFAMQNRLAQSFALRFVAGETLDQAINAVRSLNARGMTATLDHLGENVSSREEALEATNAAVRMIAEVVRAGVRCNVSLKLTQLGLDLGDSFALDNMQRVLEQADESELFVRIDMESANYVDQTLDIFYRLFEQRKNVGAVIQSCLYRSEMDLERLIEAGARVRLVKGAYFEPPSVAFQAKSDVDSNYVRLMEILLARGNYPAIATHDAS
ncbi:MAG TPA: proline dehydrogenase family protein, partial [Chloroflexota bacterium]